MKYNYKTNTLIISLLWLASWLCVGSFAYAQTESNISAPVEILMAEPELAGSSVSAILFKQAKQYHDGDGVTQDFLRAQTLYLKAAGMGNNDARINLGYLYFMGEGVNQSYEKAHNWYLSAANNGSKDAQLNLAMIYQNGFGVPKDDTKAEYWRTYDQVKPTQKKAIEQPVAKTIVRATLKETVQKPVQPKPVVTKAPVNIPVPVKISIPKPDSIIHKAVENKTITGEVDPALIEEQTVGISQKEQLILNAHILTPTIQESLTGIGGTISAINKKAVLPGPTVTLRSFSGLDNKEQQTLPQWISNLLAAIMLSLVLSTSIWFFSQYTKIGKQKKAHVFAKAFYAHHRDRLRINYLRYPKKHQKIDTMDDTWAVALSVLMVRFAQSQKDEDTLVGMQSNKIIQALNESPFKAKQAVFPFVKVTQIRIFDDIQAHEFNFMDTPENFEDPPRVKIKEAVPVAKIKDVLTMKEAKKPPPMATPKEVLESNCPNLVKLRSASTGKQKPILSEDIPPNITK